MVMMMILAPAPASSPVRSVATAAHVAAGQRRRRRGTWRRKCSGVGAKGSENSADVVWARKAMVSRVPPPPPPLLPPPLPPPLPLSLPLPHRYAVRLSGLPLPLPLIQWPGTSALV